MSTQALTVPEIPQSIDELTPAWLTQTLQAGGFLDGVRVVGAEPEILGEGEGFVGQIVRLRLSFDGPAPGAPESLIAKMPIGLEQNRTLGEALGALRVALGLGKNLVALHDIRQSVVEQGEDVGGDLLAEAVAGAQILVDPDLHRVSLILSLI